MRSWQKIGLVFIIASLIIIPNSSRAIDTIETGNDLLLTCRDSGVNGEAVCIGFVIGVVKATTVKICNPSKGTWGQAKDIVLKYLIDNPKDRSLEATFLTLLALTAAWPCPDKK